MTFIFNPDTDYALAVGKRQYTPPKNVEKLRMRLTPHIAHALSPGDKLMVFSEDERIILLSQIDGEQKIPDHTQVILPEEAASLLPDNIATRNRHDYLRAWGWNHTIYRELSNYGISRALLPSEKEIDILRELSHRRSTIVFNKRLNSILGLDTPLPVESSDFNDAITMASEIPNCFIKAPWSSSGRGVAPVSSLSDESMRKRIKGTIDRQGSIMLEHGAFKILDFATEWYIDGGNVDFLGLSVFNTRPTGEYGGNMIQPQKQLEELVRQASPLWNISYIEAQKKILEEIIAPNYTGPVGIDMLIDKHGKIWPCIELNLRYTMGHVSIAIDRNSHIQG